MLSGLKFRTSISLRISPGAPRRFEIVFHLGLLRFSDWLEAREKVIIVCFWYPLPNAATHWFVNFYSQTWFCFRRVVEFVRIGEMMGHHFLAFKWQIWSFSFEYLFGFLESKRRLIKQHRLEIFWIQIQRLNRFWLIWLHCKITEGCYWRTETDIWVFGANFAVDIFIYCLIKILIAIFCI